MSPETPDPPIFTDVKTGLGIGKLPIALAIVTCLLWEAADVTIHDMADNGESGSTATNIWPLLLLYVLSWFSLLIACCWILTNWLRAEFGLAKGFTQMTLLGYVFIQQLCTWVVSQLITAIIGLLVIFLLFAGLFIPLSSAIVPETSSVIGMLAFVIPAAIVTIATSLGIYAVGMIFALRYSSGLAITVTTGKRMSLGESYSHSIEATPRGTVFKTALKFSAALHLVPLAFGVIAFAVITLFLQDYFNVTMTSTSLHIQPAEDAANGYVSTILAGLLYALISTAWVFAYCLTIIRFLRQAQVPDTAT